MPPARLRNAPRSQRKRYHVLDAFPKIEPTGSTPREKLRASFQAFSEAAFEATLAELDVDHRKRRPAGEGFTSVERWIRDRLAYAEKRIATGSSPPASKPTKPERVPKFLTFEVGESNAERFASLAKERGSAPCPKCHGEESLVVSCRGSTVRQLLCSKCLEVTP